MLRSIFALALVVFLTTAGSVQAQGWVKKLTGGAVSTPTPIQKIAPNGIQIGKGEQSTSSLQVIVGPYITTSGAVMYGTNTGNVRQIATASLTFDSAGRAYWRYQGAENSPLRAAGRDRPVNRTTKYEIDAGSGVVYRVAYENGVRQLGSHQVTRVPVRYNNQGRPYYTYNGQTVWANNQPWRQSMSSQPKPVQGVQRPQNNQPSDPGAAIAIGILQAINQAAQNRP